MDPSSQKHLALRVALDTMKDRCILQQKRLTEVEEENQELRERLQQQPLSHKNAAQHNSGGVAENFQLRLQVSELQRQNTQLNAHIGMVSAENRKLWSRLSQIAKDQSAKPKDNDCTLTAGDADVVGDGSPRGISNQNLIRSKTFTQHSPNPNLRHKLISAENCDSDLRDVSLEEDVALEVYGDGEESANAKQQLTHDEEMAQVAMGFGYLNVDESNGANATQEQDFNLEAKKCIEGLKEMRREAMRQQKELNSVFALLESRIALQPCPECVTKCQKPEMADKSLETDESFNDSRYTNHHEPNKFDDLPTKSSISALAEPQPIKTNHMNIIHEKLLADESNKICPMCGVIYDSAVTFESFCEHVEDHFRDDSIDVNHSIETNFELISHAVGDF